MFRNFIHETKGSAVLLVAISSLAVVGGVGVAVDVGRGQMVQAKLQNAVDAAALAAGATLSTNDLNAVADRYVSLNFSQNNLGATLNAVDATLSADSKTVTVTASATVPTTLTQVFDRVSMQISASSEVTRSNKGLELALVLDTTGSMGGSKLAALKTSAHDLIDILFGSDATGDNLWVGVVPFSQTVNIGSSRTDWLNASHYAGLDWGPTSWAGCVDARYSTGRDITDDPPYDPADPTDQTPPAPYELLKAYYWPDDGNNNWKGTSNSTVNTWLCYNKTSCTCSNYGPCTTTVDGNVSTTISCTGSGSTRKCKKAVTTTTTTYSITSSKGPNTNCPSAITPLTNVKATVGSGIDALVARGYTHVNYGAVWGWRLISPRWRGYWGGDMNTNNLPLNYNAPLMSKAVILMTDGANTTNSSVRTAYDYPSVSGMNSSQLNSKTTTVCNAMKAQGVIVYTILFQETDNTIKTLLRNCATTPDHFFDSPTESSLQAAFQTIGDSLANLRISR
jgi:Flp pilus assembly protein TadG